jgi:hypothetical protein
MPQMSTKPKFIKVIEQTGNDGNTFKTTNLTHLVRVPEGSREIEGASSGGNLAVIFRRSFFPAIPPWGKSVAPVFYSKRDVASDGIDKKFPVSTWPLPSQQRGPVVREIPQKGPVGGHTCVRQLQ